MASHHNCYISRLTVLAADREDSKTYQITVENVLGAETHSLDLRVHGRQPRHRGLGLSISAQKSSIRRFIITEKAPTRAFS